MPSNVADLAAPMHVGQQHYWVTPTGLARPKGLYPQKILGGIIIKILNKNIKNKIKKTKNIATNGLPHFSR
jgi:hypothetical protein